MFKIIQVYERYDGANKMQIEQYYEELTTELEKWQSEISPEY